MWYNMHNNYTFLEIICSDITPANAARWNEDVLMLAQRLRRWPNNKTSVFQRVVFAGHVRLLQLRQQTVSGIRTA